MRSLLVAALLVGGCGSKSDGASCDQVVDNMMAVTKQAMTGHGDMELQNRKQMIDQCVARKMSADQRACLASAKTIDAIAACTPKK